MTFLERRDDLDIAAQHRVEVAATLARQRTPYTPGKIPCAANASERGSDRTRSCIVEDGVEHRRRHAPLEQLERLDKGQTGLEQRRQLLIEDRNSRC
jgi:hypothetical protein